MCTLIVGRSVIDQHSTLLAANRDENPGRPSAPPEVLCERPRVVGGRDLVARGTWLAVREGPAVVALLNRYEPAAPVDGVQEPAAATVSPGATLRASPRS